MGNLCNGVDHARVSEDLLHIWKCTNLSVAGEYFLNPRYFIYKEKAVRVSPWGMCGEEAGFEAAWCVCHAMPRDLFIDLSDACVMCRCDSMGEKGGFKSCFRLR